MGLRVGILWWKIMLKNSSSPHLIVTYPFHAFSYSFEMTAKEKFLLFSSYCSKRIASESTDRSTVRISSVNNRYCFSCCGVIDVDTNSKSIFSKRTDVRKENPVVFTGKPHSLASFQQMLSLALLPHKHWIHFLVSVLFMILMWGMAVVHLSLRTNKPAKTSASMELIVTITQYEIYWHHIFQRNRRQLKAAPSRSCLMKLLSHPCLCILTPNQLDWEDEHHRV